MALFGSSGGYKQLPTKTGGQTNFLEQLLALLGGQGGLGQGFQKGIDYYSKLLSGEPGAFEEFEAPIKRQFEEQVLPGIAERFSGAGAGAQSSSAFQQSLGQAGAGLSENLARLRAELQGGAASSLGSLFSGLGSLGLGTNTFENVYEQGSPGLLDSLLAALGGGLGGGIGQGLGGGIGSLLSRLFGR